MSSNTELVIIIVSFPFNELKKAPCVSSSVSIFIPIKWPNLNNIVLIFKYKSKKINKNKLFILNFYIYQNYISCMSKNKIILYYFQNNNLAFLM